MVKGGKKTNIGYVYGVMEELQRLRDSVAALTDKNRDLAKQLNVTKMELARERKTLQAVLTDQAKAWIKTKTHVHVATSDASVQCDLSVEDTSSSDASAYGRLTPPRTMRVSSPHDSRRSLSPTIKIVRRELLLVGTSRRQGSPDRIAHTTRLDEDVTMRTPSPIKYPALSSSPDLASEAEDTIARSLAPQFERHRRLRHRTHEISYVEPPLNMKIRRGDHYGLIKRPRNMSPRQNFSFKRRQSTNHTNILLALAAAAPRVTTSTASSSPRRRPTRPRKPVSYVLPKLNTKLRQGDKFTFTT